MAPFSVTIFEPSESSISSGVIAEKSSTTAGWMSPRFEHTETSESATTEKASEPLTESSIELPSGGSTRATPLESTELLVMSTKETMSAETYGSFVESSIGESTSIRTVLPKSVSFTSTEYKTSISEPMKLFSTESIQPSREAVSFLPETTSEVTEVSTIISGATEAKTAKSAEFTSEPVSEKGFPTNSHEETSTTFEKTESTGIITKALGESTESPKVLQKVTIQQHEGASSHSGSERELIPEVLSSPAFSTETSALPEEHFSSSTDGKLFISKNLQYNFKLLFEYLK